MNYKLLYLHCKKAMKTKKRRKQIQIELIQINY